MSNGFGNTHTLPPPDLGKFVKATVSGYELGYPTDANGKTLDDKVDKDSVVMATVRIVQSKLLTADAQPAFRIMGDGKIEWGLGGGSAPNLSLYRYGNDALGMSAGLAVRHDWGIWTEGSSPGASNMISHYAPGTDNQPRIRIKGDGQIEWGPGGSSATDTTLRRIWASGLKTDGALVASPLLSAAPSASNTAIAAWIDGSPTFRFEMTGDGKMWWTGAGGTPDVNLYRDAADWLATDDNLWVKGNSIFTEGNIETSGGILLVGTTALDEFVLATYLTTDARDRFDILGDGKHRWGDGVAIPDTDLFRSGAASLYTNSQFAAVGQIIAKANTAQQIALAYDGKLYFGNALDTNLYRSGASTLKTDGDFFARGDKVRLTDGPLGQGYIAFGSSQDTNLFRKSSDNLATDDTLWANQLVTTAAAGTIYLGSALDATLYRVGANHIRTSGNFTVPGTLEVLGSGPGAPYSGFNVYFPSCGSARWIEVDAPDSGGSGYRNVRVLN